MKYKFLSLIIVVVIVLSSCSSRYKTMQTPDDLYYSPAVETPIEPTVTTPIPTATNNYYYDDYYLHHKVRNHTRWQLIDDYGYWHDTRYHHYSNNWNGYNTYSGWGNYNDGYYSSYNGYNNYYGYGNYYNGWGGYNNWYGSYWNPYGNYGYYGWYNPNQNIHYPTTIKVLPNSSTIPYQNQHYNNSNYTYNQETGTYQGTNIANDKKVSRTRTNASGNSWSTPVRTFDNKSSPNKNAGGNSGGFNSKGSNTSKPRG
jgi:hypothetical protein